MDSWIPCDFCPNHKKNKKKQKKFSSLHPKSDIASNQSSSHLQSPPKLLEHQGQIPLLVLFTENIWFLTPKEEYETRDQHVSIHFQVFTYRFGKNKTKQKKT